MSDITPPDYEYDANTTSYAAFSVTGNSGADAALPRFYRSQPVIEYPGGRPKYEQSASSFL